ncbi:mannose-6-phosphate isomerase, class I [Bacillus sp. BRMEA1]|uniref:mannose-6-phosphate isomerase, class I n=1 Tax=Neobacillus endophyticus TaxID=2738405 RepID=UPI00156436ED|nr:mannose-6-phosphate isomerase, class I [Neobacillus endophyticus]NRD76776.1 mannose-6-phosphate isomerase, class I [Neobacillus endophyticus]
MMQPLFLKPVFKERIWGGTALRMEFGYEIPTDHTGECWAISAHPNGPSIVENGPYAGMTLDRLWREQPELFGNPKEEVFPLLTKVLDADMDLSVQVHPDDTYAKVNENGELGKTECWYIIDCKEGAEMIFGHTAKTTEDLVAQVKEGKWSDLLRRVKIKPGDFFYVPSGTIHALCEGTLVLETQQSSDTTYRVYDYDRRDAEGNLRELHLEKAIEVTTVPHQDAVSTPQIEEKDQATITTFVESEFFSVYKWEIQGKEAFSFTDRFLLASVIKGEGTLVHDGEQYELKKGSHFLLPVGVGEFEFAGNMELIVSHT